MIQGFSFYRVIGLSKIYKLLRHLIIVFPPLLKNLLNAKYMVNSNGGSASGTRQQCSTNTQRYSRDRRIYEEGHEGKHVECGEYN